MNTLEMSSQLITYLTMVVVGFIVVAWSFLFGGHDHDHDSHVGHDHDAGHDHGQEPMVSMFSPKVIAAFVLGFGAGGAIATVYGGSVIISVIAGFIVGSFVAFIALMVMKLIYSQQGSSSINQGEAIGKSGIVSTSIPEGSVGEVSVTVRGTSQTYTARSKDGGIITTGTRVAILEDIGGTLIVQRV